MPDGDQDQLPKLMRYMFIHVDADQLFLPVDHKAHLRLGEAKPHLLSQSVIQHRQLATNHAKY